MDYFAHSPDTNAMLERLANEEPATLACMHGSGWRGDCAGLLRDLANTVSSRQSRVAYAGGALALGDPLRNKSAGCLNDWASRLRGKRASASASTIGVATRHTVACDRCAWVLFAVLLLSIGRKERP
jgi:hypothetical protein